MKSMLTMTDRGVVTLPAKLRKALGLEAGDPLIAETTPDGGLLLRPAVMLPIEIYSDARVRELDEAEKDLDRVLRGGSVRPGRSTRHTRTARRNRPARRPH